MPTSTLPPKPRRGPQVLARLRRGPRPVPKRPGTEFDSSDPEGLVRRLDDSDCFCRDTKVGRMYHPKEVSYREISSRDSLHVTLRNGRTVATHVDRHSPLAQRQPGGDCRYSPLRIAAHNITGAARDLLRLATGDERDHEHVRALVDDRNVSEALNAKERSNDRPVLFVSDATGLVTDARPQSPPHAAGEPAAGPPAVGEAPRRGPR